MTTAATPGLPLACRPPSGRPRTAAACPEPSCPRESSRLGWVAEARPRLLLQRALQCSAGR
eukprot:2238119-Pyramimonas_sp.AAC.1